MATSAPTKRTPTAPKVEPASTDELVIPAATDTATATATATTEPPAPVVVTGYASTVTFLASRYKQGGRTVYSLDLSPTEIASLVVPPDPDVPSPGNRAIRPAHADAFGKYIREHAEWVSPSMMLRTPSIFDFTVRDELSGIQFGTLSIPRRRITDLHIIDGQHRILGIVRAEKNIATDLDKAQSNLAIARRNEPKGNAEKDARKRIAELETQRDRLETQRVNVQIIVEADPVKYKQMFFDIADNALGISASVKSRFDSRKIVNRALASVMLHPLLVGRVDPEGDRISRGSIYLMGAKHVAEIIRTTSVGLEGRVSRRQEEELKESEVVEAANRFLNMMIDAFPQMKAMSLGQIAPDDVKRTSLLGSVLFFRIVAGAYYELLVDKKWQPSDIEEFFAQLAPHTAGPVYPGSIWMTETPGSFQDNGMAPQGRRQDSKALKDTLVEWAMFKPDFLAAAPAERPPVPVEEVDPEYGIGYTASGGDIPVVE